MSGGSGGRYKEDDSPWFMPEQSRVQMSDRTKRISLSPESGWNSPGSVHDATPSANKKQKMTQQDETRQQQPLLSPLVPASSRKEQISLSEGNKRQTPHQETALDDDFQKRILQLAQYKKQHGDLAVPFDQPEYKDLFQWMESIRQEDAKLINLDKSELLSNEHRVVLDAIGFDWVYDQTFQRRLKDLQAFQQEQATSGEEGDVFHVPNARDNLGKWCCQMRAYHRDIIAGKFKGSDHRIERTKSRIEWLQKMGMAFPDHLDAPVSWEERFQQLVAFKELKGHCNVPQHWSENKTLGKWVNSQRKSYSEKPSCLTQERIQKLEALGFCWKVRDRFFDKDWEGHVSALETYKQRQGDCNVPHLWPEDPLLSKWVVRVREEYRKYENGKPSKLNEGRIKRLAELGFQW